MLSKKILIVDDEERIRFLLRDFLEDFGDFSIALAASAEEGLELLHDFQADLCIVDIRLPGLNGEQFVLEAAKQGLCGNFVLHTGSLDFRLSNELIELGLGEKDVFLKPCDMDSLLARLRAKLNLADA